MTPAFLRPAKAAAAALLLAAVLGPPAQAETGGSSGPGGNLGAVLDETTSTVLRLFQTFMKAIPQFETPEVLPNGDIIIRRKPQDEGKGAPEHEDDPEEGETRQI